MSDQEQSFENKNGKFLTIAQAVWTYRTFWGHPFQL